MSLIRFRFRTSRITSKTTTLSSYFIVKCHISVLIYHLHYCSFYSVSYCWSIVADIWALSEPAADGETVCVAVVGALARVAVVRVVGTISLIRSITWFDSAPEQRLTRRTADSYQASSITVTDRILAKVAASSTRSHAAVSVAAIAGADAAIETGRGGIDEWVVGGITLKRCIWSAMASKNLSNAKAKHLCSNNKKAQLSLTNPRDAKACRNCFNSACLQRCR